MRKMTAHSSTQSRAELFCVDPLQVGHFWPHVEPLLRPAIQNVGLSDFDDIASEILTGGALVWIAWDGEKIAAAASTTLQRIGPDSICVLTACGGQKMDSWLSLLGKIEDYAKAEGCKALRIFGREGWLRVLDGYQKTAIVIEKEFA
jgi:hypothetical protein